MLTAVSEHCDANTAFHTCISRELAKQKAPNKTIAEFVNTVDPDETAQNEPSHLDLQCLPSSLGIFST